MFSKNVFSEKLLELRKANNLTQTQLGEIVGVSYHAIQKIEKSERAASIEVIYALADYFNVSIDYLVGRDIQSDEPICNTSVTIKRKGIKHVYSVSDDTVDIVEGLLKKLSNQE